MKIAFDFDGVICNSYDVFRGHFYDVYGYDMGSAEEHHCFKFNIPYEDYWKEIPVAITRYQHIMPGIQDSINTLIAYYEQIKTPIHIITAREPSQAVMQVTHKWLKKHLKVPYTCDFLSSSKAKKDFILQHEIQYFVDDRRKTCINLSEVVDYCFMFKQPWNDQKYRNDKLPENVLRIGSIYTALRNVKWLEDKHGEFV